MTAIIFVLYLLMMLGIGAYFSRKANSLNAYYLGDRGMNKWVVAMSAQASDMSGWMLMGLPGAIYLSGFSEAWIGIGLVIGTYFNWKIVGRRLRKYSHFCGDSITLPDFLSNRFRDKKGVIRVIASIFILAFFLFYTVSGFVASAKLFGTIFGLDYTTGLVIGGVVVVSYTFMGGFFAVCWTDFIQALMMLLAVLIIPTIICVSGGGFAETMDAVNGQNPFLMSLFTNASSGKAIGFISLISSLAWGLGYFGMPHILVRFMSIKNAEEITHSRRIAMTWVTVCLGAVIMIGLLGRYYVSANSEALIAQGLIAADGSLDPERIFMVLCQALCHPVIASILMAAILAAIMSTADSQLLVSASAFSNDMYKHLFRKNASNKELMWVSRVVVAAIAVIAVLIAYQGRPEEAPAAPAEKVEVVAEAPAASAAPAVEVPVAAEKIASVDSAAVAPATDSAVAPAAPVAEATPVAAEASAAEKASDASEPVVAERLEELEANAADEKVVAERFDEQEAAVAAAEAPAEETPAPAKKKGFLDVVMSLVSFAWAGFGATFGPLVLLALFWKRTNLAGAVAGMLVGGITAFVWKFYLAEMAGVHEIFGLYELVPGFVLSFVTIVVVSLLTKAPSKDITDEFDAVEHTRLSDMKL
ncbi:MAG: sodium/proline symporter [Fibrobacter sp.]|nr:sodium/proline symporter [Fibrobacter sp.]